MDIFVVLSIVFYLIIGFNIGYKWMDKTCFVGVFFIGLLLWPVALPIKEIIKDY